ncbi:MAG TPA: MFS transporter [Actinobacteria bacterium]|nr:MFS transporter [Actinomycetota bacterium]
MGAVIAVGYAIMGDRQGRRRPFLAATLLLFLATAATAFANGPLVYTVLQGLTRMGGAAAGALAVVLLAEQLRPDSRAWGIAVYAAATAFGSGIGLFALPIARMGEQSWRVLFGLAALGLIVYPLLSSKLPESPAFRPVERPASFLAVPFGAHARGFWTLAAYSLLVASFGVIVITFGLERLVNDLGYTTGAASWIMLVGGTVGGIGFFAGGRMADTMGRKATISVALLAGLVGGVGFYWLSSPPLLIFSWTVSTFGGFASIPAAAAQRNELFPTEVRATAVQWINSTAVLGSMLGLAVGAATIDVWGLPRTVATLGIGVILAIVIQTFVPESLGTQLDQDNVAP